MLSVFPKKLSRVQTLFWLFLEARKRREKRTMKKQKTIESKQVETRLSKLFSDLPVHIWRHIVPGLDWNEADRLFQTNKTMRQQMPGMSKREDLLFNLRQRQTVLRLVDDAAFQKQVVDPSASSLRSVKVTLGQWSQVADQMIEERLTSLVSKTQGLKRFLMDFPHLVDLVNQAALAESTQRWSALVYGLLKRLPATLERLVMYDTEGVSSTILSHFDPQMLAPLWGMDRVTPFSALRVLRIEATDDVVRTEPVPQVVVSQMDLLTRLLPGLSRTIEWLVLPLAEITEDLFVHMATIPCPELQSLKFTIWKTVAKTGELARPLGQLSDQPDLQAKTIREADQSLLRLFEGVSKLIDVSPRLGYFKTVLMDFKQGRSRLLMLNAPLESNKTLQDAKNQQVVLDCSGMFHERDNSSLLHEYLLRLITGLGMSQKCAKVFFLQNGCESPIQATEKYFQAALQRVLGTKVLQELSWQGDMVKWATADDVKAFCSVFPNVVRLNEVRRILGFGNPFALPRWSVQPDEHDAKMWSVQIIRSDVETLSFWGPRVRTLTLINTLKSPADILNTYPCPRLFQLIVPSVTEDNLKQAFHGVVEETPSAQSLRVLDIRGRVADNYNILKHWGETFPRLSSIRLQMTSPEWPHPADGYIFHPLRNLRQLILISTVPSDREMNWIFKPNYLVHLIQANPGLEYLTLDTPSILLEQLPLELPSTLKPRLRSFQARWNRRRIGMMKLDQVEAFLHLFSKLEILDLSLESKPLTAQERHNLVVQPPPEGYGPVSPLLFVTAIQSRSPWHGKRVRLPGALPLVSKVPFQDAKEVYQELIQHMPWETKEFVARQVPSADELVPNVQPSLITFHNKMSQALVRVFQGAKSISNTWGIVMILSNRLQILVLFSNEADPNERILVRQDSQRFELVNNFGRLNKPTTVVIRQRLAHVLDLSSADVELVDGSVIFHPDIAQAWTGWTGTLKLVFGYWMATLRAVLRPDYPMALIFHWFGSTLSTEDGTPVRRLARFCTYLLQTPHVDQSLRVHQQAQLSLTPALKTSTGFHQSAFLLEKEEQDEQQRREQDNKAMVRAIQTRQPWTSKNKTLEFIPAPTAAEQSRLFIHSSKTSKTTETMNQTGSLVLVEETLGRILSTIPGALHSVALVFA